MGILEVSKNLFKQTSKLNLYICQSKNLDLKRIRKEIKYIKVLVFEIENEAKMR